MMKSRFIALTALLVAACGPSAEDHPAGATPYTADEKAAISRGAARIDSAATASTPCDMNWSETEIAARRATGLITAMDVTSAGLLITVNEDRLAQRPAGTLESLVESADCAIAGPTGHLVRINVEAAGSGRPIATYEATELLKMRKRVQQ